MRAVGMAILVRWTGHRAAQNGVTSMTPITLPCIIHRADSLSNLEGLGDLGDLENADQKDGPDYVSYFTLPWSCSERTRGRTTTRERQRSVGI